MNPTPRILLFTGDGKGKTTAALGMAIRALGHNLPTLIIQFIKGDNATSDGWSTGEYSMFSRLPNVEIRQTGLGFVPPRASPQFADHQQAACRALDAAAQALQEDLQLHNLNLWQYSS